MIIASGKRYEEASLDIFEGQVAVQSREIQIVKEVVQVTVVVLKTKDLAGIPEVFKANFPALKTNELLRGLHF